MSSHPALQQAELLSFGAAGKVLEVDEWADAQVAVREQTARARLDTCIEKCRLVSLCAPPHALCKPCDVETHSPFSCDASSARALATTDRKRIGNSYLHA